MLLSNQRGDTSFRGFRSLNNFFFCFGQSADACTPFSSLYAKLMVSWLQLHIDHTFMRVMSHLLLDMRTNAIISQNVKLFI